MPVHSARGCLCLSISAACVPAVNRAVQKPFTFGLWHLGSSCGNKGDLHIRWNRRWNCGLALHIASFDGDPSQSCFSKNEAVFQICPQFHTFQTLVGLFCQDVIACRPSSQRCCLSISADCVPGANRGAPKPFTSHMWNLGLSYGIKGNLHILGGKRWNWWPLFAYCIVWLPPVPVLFPSAGSFQAFPNLSICCKGLLGGSVRTASHVVHRRKVQFWSRTECCKFVVNKKEHMGVAKLLFVSLLSTLGSVSICARMPWKLIRYWSVKSESSNLLRLTLTKQLVHASWDSIVRRGAWIHFARYSTGLPCKACEGAGGLKFLSGEWADWPWAKWWLTVCTALQFTTCRFPWLRDSGKLWLRGLARRLVFEPPVCESEPTRAW